MEAGGYDLVLLVDCGPQLGRSLVIVLELRRTRKDDRSPKTGAVAKDRAFSEVPLYGWINSELHGIAAPVGMEAAGPTFIPCRPRKTLCFRVCSSSMA